MASNPTISIITGQEYIDTSLLGTGQVTKAAIYGLEGPALWAASTGFAVISCLTSQRASHVHYRLLGYSISAGVLVVMKP